MTAIWKESSAFSSHRWRTFARKDLKQKILIYGSVGSAAVVGAVVFGYMTHWTLIALVPISALIILNDFFEWRGQNYARRKVRIDDSRTRLSSFLWSWSCKHDHIEELKFTELELDGANSTTIQLKTFAGEMVEVELPEEQDTRSIQRLIEQ